MQLKREVFEVDVHMLSDAEHDAFVARAPSTVKVYDRAKGRRPSLVRLRRMDR